MKRIIFGLLISFLSINTSAQFVARMEVKEPVKGICNEKEVDALFLMFDGQEEVISPMSKDNILKRLNSENQLQIN